MKNEFLLKLKSKLKIKVQGKNIERFIKRLNASHIELLNITYLKYDTCIITIYEKDFEKVNEIKTIYNVDVVDTLGLIHIKKNIKKNNIFIFSLCFGLILLYFLSNVIYKVEIIHSSSDIRKMISSELSFYGIKEKSLKKSYKSIQQIKKQILEKHKNDIEWLEIEVVGTKYVVRLEERKISNINEETEYRNIIAKKSAIIKDVVARSGEVVKFKNDYVKTGETVISGEIKLNDEVKNLTRAEGNVYGEVWYKVHVEYPYTYYEKVLTGKKRKVFVLNFLNKSFEFSLSHFKNKNVKKNIIFKSILPISFTFDLQEEVKVKSGIYTSAEAVLQAQKEARDKIESKLNDKEYIISQKNLKVQSNESTIIVDEFFTVYEDITDYSKIEIVETE